MLRNNVIFTVPSMLEEHTKNQKFPIIKIKFGVIESNHAMKKSGNISRSRNDHVKYLHKLLLMKRFLLEPMVLVREIMNDSAG